MAADEGTKPVKNRASGRYYGRFTISGKQNWINLKTKVWTVAKLRLADERGRIERRRQAVGDVAAGEAKVGELVAIYRGRIEDRTDITPGTKAAMLHAVGALLKTWDRFTDLTPDEISREAVIEWRNRVSRDGTIAERTASARRRKWFFEGRFNNECIRTVG